MPKKSYVTFQTRSSRRLTIIKTSLASLDCFGLVSPFIYISICCTSSIINYNNGYNVDDGEDDDDDGGGGDDDDDDDTTGGETVEDVGR